LLEESDLRYIGAFRLDEDWKPDNVTLEYSNGALAYYPLGNSGRGSLFVAGHVYRSMVAEYEIPTPVASKELAKLPVARVLQPLSDVLRSVPNRAGNAFIMGMVYVPTLRRIVFTHGGDYTAADCSVTASTSGVVGTFAPTLAAPGAAGLWLLSTRGRAVSPFDSARYVLSLPVAWARENVRGALVASGRHRNWCAMGPNLFAWTPADGVPGSTVAVTALMHFGAEGSAAYQSREFSHADNYGGAVWLTNNGKNAVAITGLKDWDPARSYYGYENWTYPKQCEPNNTCKGGRGWRAADPRPTLLFFNPADLGDVAQGRRPSYAVQWYTKVDLTRYALRTYPPTFLTTGADAETFLATVDADRGWLYLSESFVDGTPAVRPIIHVFQVSGQNAK
jgi:hypothetical protein